jgi:hypothetical protein
MPHRQKEPLCPLTADERAQLELGRLTPLGRSIHTDWTPSEGAARA